ncbi:S9 family peptidase [Lacibacter sp.]|uniref:S9 family peptidase n=1 Tax=Lacibacter sp. TaxID=1915409 RepID=UPI002B4AF020|nr:prolyl oligopeptidase family serine peptidase [Lacibacter sp.]HLP38477.1 prolyl oligopeptidase family serine peptidase [Lacibacter sp.]
MQKTYSSLIIIALLMWGCKEQAKAPREVKQYTIEQFFQTEGIGGGSFSKDENRILFNSNRSKIYNVYELNLADTTVKPLTSSGKESFFAVDYLPGTDDFLYSADKGGNENDHIYLQRRNGSVTDLTPGEKEKANFYGWTKDKRSFYYGSNNRNPQFFDVYKMDSTDWKPKMLYKNDSGLDVGGISFNERWLVLTKSVTSDKNEMYLFDAQSKQTKKLSTDSLGDATYYPTGFETTDTHLYYITNEGKDFTYVVKYNLETGAKENFFNTNWDVNYMSISEKGKYHVIGINEDARDKVMLFDHASGKELEMPKIEGGYIAGVTISPSETKMILTVVSDRSSANKYLYNIETKELKQLTKTLNPEVASEDLVDAEIVRFKSFDGQEIPAVYYKPHNASSSNKVPALVWVHGGPGGQSRAGYSTSIQYFVNHGYAVLAVNNRGSSGYGKAFYKMDNKNHGDKDLKDCVWGKKWLAEQEYIDSSKIGIYGGSYGGFMSLAGIIQYPKEFAVGVDLFGVTNWIRTLRSIPPYWESFKVALYDEMGDPSSADSVRLKNISPLFNTDKIKTPLLVLQGSNDPRVLQVESDEIVAGAKKNGTPVEYVLFPDEGHGFVKKENQIKAAAETLKFLNKYLKKEEPKGNLN